MNKVRILNNTRTMRKNYPIGNGSVDMSVAFL